MPALRIQIAKIANGETRVELSGADFIAHYLTGAQAQEVGADLLAAAGMVAAITADEEDIREFNQGHNAPAES
ncbi:MAG TPA: hypothetical protein VK510_03100 [Solirubrobacteraceae bacterium]|nr:hypothetical protein [Solirubrobacteraceae bacterium]